MMVNICLLLVATFHVAPMWSRYLLVQLEDTYGPLIEPPDAHGIEDSLPPLTESPDAHGKSCS